MELRQIRYVMMVAQEKSFSRAAEKLHLAQPSLSQQIAKLEREWGILLFHRLPQRVELTDAGNRFIQLATELIVKADALEREMYQFAEGNAGRIVVGSLPITGAFVLPEAFSAFTKRYPRIEVTLIEETSSNLEQMLVHGKLDMSLLTMPIQNPALLTTTVLQEEIYLSLPPQHPFAKEQVVDLKALADEPFILLKEGQGFRTISLLLCEQAGFMPKVVFESSNIQTVQALVASGMGVSFAPHMITGAMNGNVCPTYVHLSTHPDRTLVVASHKDKHLSTPMLALREEIALAGKQYSLNLM
ncbi:LysR family transcriptional regulator [Brevibacillus laterosporus]|uniref:LysR family transcriptional regulator n=1 Tax=Brevibacillus laterosporus TaxID=1465 RepID=UPI001EF1F877|nr:LysR family transcriptional regulator [Brevibacillus laterosporus]MCG7318443.1 LysR family transcriptional regulator [Brevibacillus laterosporus]